MKGFSISIPIFMLGPYLRPFLYGLIGIPLVISVLIFVGAKYSGLDSDELVASAMHWLIFSLTAGALTLFLHFMGMP